MLTCGRREESVQLPEFTGECGVLQAVLGREELSSDSNKVILVPVMADCDWSLIIVSHSVL